eukprot:TRINITY_DN3352_c0_g1_i1.p1 TRINITY_DN3352_c0_g1~~TRINITY_DN3352_c0_g1_i1.p1  ORF type:complete len:319 (-),score=69.61 TRINITY_DN3352_c0_g1_i1:376-1332(-)
MGQYFSSRSAARDGPDFGFEYEDPQPSVEEKETFETVAALIIRSKGYLSSMAEYKGCGDLIRNALSAPSAETEDAALSAVVICVRKQRELFDFSEEIASAMKSLCRLIVGLRDQIASNPRAILSRQATMRQIGLLFEFALRFDEKKMACPQLQNDFSYYRRALSRQKGSLIGQGDRIKDELANRISFFFASPTPMMKVLVDSTNAFLVENMHADRATICQILALAANILQSMLAKRRVDSAAEIEFSLRSMTGCIILFDHISEGGAFHKRSPIEIKLCVQTLKQAQPPQQGLINALRYTTIHLNDASTPRSIASLLLD